MPRPVKAWCSCDFLNAQRGKRPLGEAGEVLGFFMLCLERCNDAHLFCQ